MRPPAAPFCVEPPRLVGVFPAVRCLCPAVPQLRGSPLFLPAPFPRWVKGVRGAQMGGPAGPQPLRGRLPRGACPAAVRCRRPRLLILLARSRVGPGGFAALDRREQKNFVAALDRCEHMRYYELAGPMRARSTRSTLWGVHVWPRTSAFRCWGSFFGSCCALCMVFFTTHSGAAEPGRRCAATDFPAVVNP